MAADDHRWAERLADVCSRLDLDGIRFTIEQAIIEARGKERRKAEQEIERLKAVLGRITAYETVAGMHDQDRADRLRDIARAALLRE